MSTSVGLLSSQSSPNEANISSKGGIDSSILLILVPSLYVSTHPSSSNVDNESDLTVVKFCFIAADILANFCKSKLPACLIFTASLAMSPMLLVTSRS